MIYQFKFSIHEQKIVPLMEQSPVENLKRVDLQRKQFLSPTVLFAEIPWA